jgi:LmbE family N-acetylglucosaminyl deacetylase
MWRPIGAAMSLGRPRQVVFFVCHPDDEALWVGGLVSGLGRFGVEVSVICASGGGQGSVRAAEFQSAREVAGYKRGLVLGGPLRAANEPLPPLALTLEAGLTQLGIDPSEVALLVTHSPYGDEHRHPHHKQAYQELKQWAQGSRVPFGFFSCMPLPWLQHQPIAASLRRAHGLSLIGVFECRPAVQSAAMIDGGGRTTSEESPRYYFQFDIDVPAKARMLARYPSIDLEKHATGYVMFGASFEALYVFDEKGAAVLFDLYRQMDHSGVDDLFAEICSRAAEPAPSGWWRRMLNLVRG